MTSFPAKIELNYRCVTCNIIFGDPGKLKNHLQEVHFNCVTVTPSDQNCGGRSEIETSLEIAKSPIPRESRSRTSIPKRKRSYSDDGIRLNSPSNSSEGNDSRVEKETPNGGDQAEVSEEDEPCNALDKPVESPILGTDPDFAKAEDNYRCSKCDKDFSFEEALDLHAFVGCNPKNQESFSCTKCDQTFEKQVDLAIHFTESHLTVQVENQSESNSVEEAYHSSHDIDMEEDLAGQPEVTPRKNSRTIRSVETEPEVNAEADIVQDNMDDWNPGPDLPILDTPAKKQCKYCGKFFKSGLNRHVDSVHTKITHKCDKCEKSYTWKSQLDKHKLVHDPDSNRKEQCHLCSRMFVKDYLQKHIESVHNGIAKFEKCKFCNKTIKLDMNRHVREVHLNMNLRKCGQCDQTYKTEKNLRAHIKRVHQGSLDTKKTCKYCDQKMNESYLAKHIALKHEGEKNGRLKCSKCDLCFMTQFKLIRHDELVHRSLNDKVHIKTKHIQF